MGHSIRTLRVDDAADIGALLDWAWFAPRSEAGWKWLCRTPRSQAARSIPIGMVAEDGDGRVGGLFGLFVQDYVGPDGPTLGGSGHTLIVHPRLRGASRNLIDAVLEQRHLFGLSVFNGNALGAPIYARHGMTPWPPERGDLRLVWIVNPLAILAERAARATASRSPAAVRPATERFVRSRVFERDLIRLGPRVRQIAASEIGAGFDAFWSALAAEGRLTARRDAASYRWRMSDPDRTLDPFLLTWMDGEAVGGVLLAQIGKGSEIDFPSLEIIDLVALEACADRAIPELAAALIGNAARLGVARVRLPVVSQELERRLSVIPGMMRRRRHVHGQARFADPVAAAAACDWRLTPYDADYGFCLRTPPRPAEARRAA